MSINLFLVRHAVKEKAIGDVSITPKGIIQAQLTAQHFCTRPITGIVSSPLQRAKDIYHRSVILLGRHAKE